MKILATPLNIANCSRQKPWISRTISCWASHMSLPVGALPSPQIWAAVTSMYIYCNWNWEPTFLSSTIHKCLKNAGPDISITGLYLKSNFRHQEISISKLPILPKKHRRALQMSDVNFLVCDEQFFFLYKSYKQTFTQVNVSLLPTPNTFKSFSFYWEQVHFFDMYPFPLAQLSPRRLGQWIRATPQLFWFQGEL